MDDNGIKNKDDITSSIIPPELEIIIDQQGNDKSQRSEVTKPGSYKLQHKYSAIIKFAGNKGIEIKY
jgi:hypothetical protein